MNKAGVTHAAQHANANDAIEAIEATLGTSPQGSAASVSARIAAVESRAVVQSLSLVRNSFALTAGVDTKITAWNTQVGSITGLGVDMSNGNIVNPTGSPMILSIQAMATFTQPSNLALEEVALYVKSDNARIIEADSWGYTARVALLNLAVTTTIGPGEVVTLWAWSLKAATIGASQVGLTAGTNALKMYVTRLA
jgi:hypothetical protein